jgi:ABC-2 type transport system ATP-binding protein
MKQKLALACTLVHEPQVILLDEPTTGVDPVSRREFWKLLSQFLAQGITIVMSTPYLDEAERCSRIALLHEGQVLALDQPSRLRASLPGTLFEVVVPSPREALDKLSPQPIIASAQVFGDRLHVWIDHGDRESANDVLSAATRAAGLTISSQRLIVPSLEDVFIARLGRVPSAESTNSSNETNAS